MAQTALTIVGFTVGNALVPGLGGSIGAALGAYLGASIGPNQQGPRLGDKSVQISSYGAMLARTWGGVQIAGNVIWAAPLIESESTQSAKGGPEVTTFSYAGTFAVGLADRPRDRPRRIASLRRIWFGTKLVYDVSEDADTTAQAVSASFEASFDFYDGSETQLPDPTIESYEGAGNVEAFRGTVYVVFKNIPLAEHGNILPIVRVETATDEVESVASSDLQPYLLYPWEVGGEGPRHSNGGLMQFIVQSGLGATISTHSDYDEARAAMLAYSGGIATEYIGYWTSGEASGDSILDRFGADGGAQDEIELEEGPRYCWLAFNVEQPVEIHSDGNSAITPELCAVLLGQSADPLDGIVRMFSSTTDTGGSQGHAGLIRFGPYPGPSEPGYDDVANNCIDYPAVAGHFPVARLSEHFRIRVERLLTPTLVSCVPGDPVALGIAELPSDPSFCISDAGEITPKFEYEEVTGTFKQLQALVQDTGIDGSYVSKRPLGPILAPSDPNYSDSAYWTAAAAAAGVSGTYGVDFPVVVTIATSGSATHGRVAAGAELLSEIVSDICQDAGLGEDQIDVSELDDVVDGYVAGRLGAARNWLDPLRTAYWWDAVQSGGMIRFVKRSPDATVSIPLADLGASLDDPDEPITHDRGQESELPRRVTVAYAVRAADYETGSQYASRRTPRTQQEQAIELPLVLTDARAAEIAAVVMYDAWISRVVRKFCLTLEYAALEPTDVVEVSDGERLYSLRITHKDDEGCLLRFEAVDSDVAIENPNAVGGETSGGGSTIRFDGPTNLVPLDVPIFRRADDDAGYYLAASGYGPTWRGGRAFRSIDDGAHFTTLLDLTRRATIGFATTALGDWTGGSGMVDESNSVDVTLHAGELESITRAQLLALGNVAALGAEILQFQRAEFLGGSSYRLTGLLRGRLGTEQHQGSHATRDVFALITDSSIFRITSPATEIDVAQVLRGVTIGQTIEDGIDVDFTNTGVGLMPLSPVHLSVAPAAGGGYLATWVRRTRYSDGGCKIGADAPLGEDSESYDVEVINSGGAVVLSVSVTEPSASLGAPAATVSLGLSRITAVEQIGSDTFGLGYSAPTVRVFDAGGTQTATGPYLGDLATGSAHSATDYYATVSNTGAGSKLQRIAASAPTVLAATADVGTVLDGQGICFDGTDLWLTQTFSNFVSRMHPTGLGLVDQYIVTGGPCAISPDGGSLWVACRDSNEIAELDPSDGSEIQRFPVVTFPTDVCAVGGIVFVCGVDSCASYDGATGDLIATAPAVGGIAKRTVSPWGDFVAVSDSDADMLRRFDAATGALIDSVSVPDLLWIAGFSGATLFVIQQATDGLTLGYEDAASDFGGMTLRVYQRSAAVGRGFPAEITIP